MLSPVQSHCSHSSAELSPQFRPSRGQCQSYGGGGATALQAMQNIHSRSSSRPVHCISCIRLGSVLLPPQYTIHTDSPPLPQHVQTCKDARKKALLYTLRLRTVRRQGSHAPRPKSLWAFGHRMDRARSAPLMYNTPSTLIQLTSKSNGSAQVWGRVGCDRCWLASRFNDPLVDGGGLLCHLRFTPVVYLMIVRSMQFPFVT